MWEEKVKRPVVHYPRVDPAGEYVAFTFQGTSGPKVALKQVTDPAERMPTFLMPQGFDSAYFCDWTESGTLLCNARASRDWWMLLVIDKDGKVVRRMDTAVRPAEGVVATWRKFGHR